MYKNKNSPKKEEEKDNRQRLAEISMPQEYHGWRPKYLEYTNNTEQKSWIWFSF